MPNDVDYETRRPTCLVLTVPENTDLALFALVKQCGCTLVAEISIDAALESAEIGAFPAADYLLAPIPSVSERTADVLSKIAAYLNEYGTEALIWAEGTSSMPHSPSFHLGAAISSPAATILPLHRC